MANYPSTPEITRILEHFLEGVYSLSQVQERLRDCLVIDFALAPGKREISGIAFDDRSITIVVRRRHVAQMLRRYLAKEISELELSNWAALVFMLPTFVPEGETEDERWEAGEGPVWKALQELGVAQAFVGDLDPEAVRGYLDLIGQC